MGLMGVLALVTVVALALAVYFLASRLAKLIWRVRESMGEIAKRRFEHRIHGIRNDEFGQLFKAFDDMAGAQRAESPAPAPVPPAGAPAATSAS